MYKYFIYIIIVLVIIKIFLYAQKCELEDSPELTVEQVKDKIDKAEDIILLDVSTKKEYNGHLGHIEGSLLIPVQELESRLEELEGYKENEIVVICRSGIRSRWGTRILLEKGFTAFNMKGGMLAWNKMLQEIEKPVEEEN
jgi:rhodanese-related sulfurtransferase